MQVSGVILGNPYHHMPVVCLTLQGRMCLMLGPPASGKSSLLKILGGKIRGNKLVQVRYTRPHTVGPRLSCLQICFNYCYVQ